MRGRFLHDNDFTRFVEALRPEAEVHGPVPTPQGVVVFTGLDDPCLFDRCSRTLLPPKKYLVPPRETVLTFRSDTGYTMPAASRRRVLLLGVHPCDLAGIAFLDSIFLSDDSDCLYALRRKNLLLGGISCEQDDFCTCASTGFSPPPCDIFMERVDDGYLITFRSNAGERLLGIVDRLLRPYRRNSPAAVPWGPPATAAAPEVLDTAASTPLLRDAAKRCLSCGICSTCCPTCHCFDLREQGELSPDAAFRLREWDNCLYRDHGEVAGGNFRRTRIERLLYRLGHKYGGLGPSHGIVSCVGCGRCRVQCPTGIDLAALLKEAPHE